MYKKEKSMKTMIVYESKRGYTENYAKMISDQLGADIYKFEDVSLETISRYETIIFGGGIYSDQINGIDRFIDLIRNESDKKVVIFGVGMSPIFNEYIDKLYKVNIEDKLQQEIKFFFFRGGVHLDRLSSIERKVLVAFLKITEIFQESYTAVTTNSKHSDDVIDFSSPDFITALIQHIEETK